MTTPLDYYYQKCREGIIFEDANQISALQSLQRIYHELLIEDKRHRSLFSYFYKPRLIKGLYLWGSVGIGKTFLMDCFFQSLPFQNKMRMHFYQFMQSIQSALTKEQGSKNPLQKIAKAIAKQTRVLCFDELFVSDIADAMVLGKLLKELFKQGVCFVATSNTEPNELYKNGLQREQFIPAINLINAQTEVIHITTKVDYRLRHLKEAGVFYTPLDDIAHQNMEKTFTVLTQGEKIESSPIIIYGRPINVYKRSKKVVWFKFNDICSVPRSQKDYLELAKQYETIFISDIPIIGSNDRDKICLFIGLVDVFYDARIRLVISAAEPVEKLYDRGHMISEYTRTHSRLTEMQSTDYFAGEFNFYHRD